MLGQDRELADDQRQLVILVGLEVEHHSERTFGDHALDVGVILAEVGPALVPESLERPDDVLGGDGLAVMETRLRPQLEGDPHAVLRNLDGLCQQPVGHAGLVGRWTQQGVVDPADLGGGCAAHDESVEAVEAAEAGEHDLAALGRVRVHIREIFEVGRQAWLSEQRDAVAAYGLLRMGWDP